MKLSALSTEKTASGYALAKALAIQTRIFVKIFRPTERINVNSFNEAERISVKMIVYAGDFENTASDVKLINYKHLLL